MDMHSRDIDMQTFADINDEANITDRVNLGGLMVTIGQHPDLGAFAVSQTLTGLSIVSEFERYEWEHLQDGLAIADALGVIRAVQNAATCLPKFLQDIT